MSDLAPLTPAACDLRDFPFMPLDVQRLRDSTVAALESGEAFRACVMAWCASWHQVPAGSLPNDDAALSALLGYGRTVAAWQEVRRAGGLHGWVLCSDGRLYHPVVAEKANEAWSRKEAQRARGRKGNEVRWGNRASEGALSQKDRTGIAEGSSGDPDPTTEGLLGDRKGQGQRQGKEVPPKAPLAAETGATPLAPRRANADPDGFAEFWLAYPRKAARQEGVRAYARVLKGGAKPHELLAGLRRFRFPDDPQFIPYPASWLNSGHWQDEAVPRPSALAHQPGQSYAGCL